MAGLKKLKDAGFLEEEGEAAPKPQASGGGKKPPKKPKDAAPEDEDDEPQPKKRQPLKDVAAPEFEVSKLHNGQLEFATLVRCVIDSELAARLWPRLSEEHFAADTTMSIYRRLRTLHQLGKEWPGLKALAMDPAVDQSARAQLEAAVAKAERGKDLLGKSIILANGHEVSLESASDFEGHVFDLLDSYRITRQGAEHMVGVIESIAEDEEFDPLMGPELVERAASEVLAIRGQESIADNLLHFGAGTMPADDLKRRQELKKLFMKDKPRFRTGIDAFDDKAGGFQGGEVVLLGANTGGGKTAAQLTMMTNMARMGTSVAMLQLELSLEQMDERVSSHLARVNSNIVRSGNIEPKIQTRIKDAWDEFHEECVQAQGRFTIYAPSSSTIAGCEMVFKQYDYKVWFIDYVNLLNLDGDEAKLQGWEKLSRITKQFKALAKKYNICIVLGVQVNIDGDGNVEIRYAKAMKEDADIVLTWHMTQEAKDEGVVWWKHLKARQYEPFDFPVKIALEYYAFENFQEEARKKKRTLGKRKVHPKDEVDQAIEGGFRKKEKPLVVEDERPMLDAILAGDLEAALRGGTSLEVDDEDDEYVDFDEE